MRMKDDEWNDIIVQLIIRFGLSKAVMRAMMKKRCGRIHHYWFCGWQHGEMQVVANYACGESGLIGSVNHWRVKLRPAGHNVVAPAVLLKRHTRTRRLTIARSGYPAGACGRLGGAQEIASAVAFLALTQFELHHW